MDWFWIAQRNVSGQEPSHESKKKRYFNQCFLPAMTYGCQTKSLTKASVTKLETSHGNENASVKQQDRIRSITIRQRTRVTDIVKCDAPP